MAANTRFAVALHALTALAFVGEPRTSEQLAAGSVNTNAVVVRRILARLVKAGILASQPGKAGGFQLARSPEDIDLGEVYRAVEGDGLFSLPEHRQVASCPVSCGIKPVLQEVFREAEGTLEAALGKQRLADILARIPAAGGAPL